MLISFCMRGCGCLLGTRLSLRPLFIEGQVQLSLGRGLRRENAELYSVGPLKPSIGICVRWAKARLRRAHLPCRGLIGGHADALPTLRTRDDGRARKFIVRKS